MHLVITFVIYFYQGFMAEIGPVSFCVSKNRLSVKVGSLTIVDNERHKKILMDRLHFA